MSSCYPGGESMTERIYAVFNRMHVVTSYLFVGLIALHVFAAVRHAFRRDGVFARMLPSRLSR